MPTKLCILKKNFVRSNSNIFENSLYTLNNSCEQRNKFINNETDKISLIINYLNRENNFLIDENVGPFTSKKHFVKKVTKTLEEVLNSVNAPTVIDYLSLDVEGHEYSILSTFPFDKYKFRCMTVEHNEPHQGPTQQMLIREILEKNGYKYVKGNDDVHNWGHGPIDDFYINTNLV